MPTAYTPGLRITAETLVTKERRLPLKGEVLVEPDAAVSPETTVARARLEGHIHSFKAAEQLGISPSELTEALQKVVGDQVEEGELLASVSGLFGLFRSECRAPVKGTIEHISPTTGFIGIRQPPRPVEIAAYMRGRITKVLPQEGVIIQSRAAFIQGIFGVGGERFGAIKTACTSPDQPLSDDLLQADMQGTVVIGGSYATGAALERAADIGVAGLVLGSISDTALRRYVGYDIGLAITGQENVPFTLILTEGFGEMPMAARTFALLDSLQNKIASINGATQIRAGVIRPEIVVPLDLEPAPSKSVAAAPGEAPAGELAPGVRVRVIREPYLGRLGEVTALPSELQTIATGAKVRVASVKIEGEQEALVPRANLEIIQE